MFLFLFRYCLWCLRCVKKEWKAKSTPPCSWTGLELLVVGLTEFYLRTAPTLELAISGIWANDPNLKEISLKAITTTDYRLNLAYRFYLYPVVLCAYSVNVP